MNTFDNATIHPHRYFSSITWKEVDKPLTTTNDELFYDLLDGKKHIDGECRPCKFVYNRNEFNPEFDYEVEPFPGFIECYSHIELDAHIAQSVAYLNQKGYKTDWCCEGHMNADTLRKGVEVEMEDLAAKDKLVVNAQGFLEKSESPAAGAMVWQVVKRYTLADGQEAVKIQRIA